jgi:fructokinase
MRLGIDLGGSKIEIVALANDGSEMLRQRIATPQGDYRATLQAIAGLVEATEKELSCTGSVGIGIPGAESRHSGLIKNANSTCLIGQPLRQDLQTLLQREIRLANDANCFALSEAIDGSAQGARSVFGVILGTGVGGGIVINGQVVAGANSIAGEWGHNPLPSTEADPLRPLPCYCGRTSCIETWLSGPGMTADHLRTRGEALAAETIASRAAAGDAACSATLTRYLSRLGRALAGVINILDPEVIVLGGGLSKIQQLYEQLPDSCGPHVFSDIFCTKILPPAHGDSSGVRGAAWLWN